MHSMRIELAKLILVSTRITYQATGDACIFFFFFFPIPFVFPMPLLISPFYSLSLLVVTQIRGHIAGSSPPYPLRFVPCISIARRLQPFLAPSTRVELMLMLVCIPARSLYVHRWLTGTTTPLSCSSGRHIIRTWIPKRLTNPLKTALLGIRVRYTF